MCMNVESELGKAGKCRMLVFVTDYFQIPFLGKGYMSKNNNLAFSLSSSLIVCKFDGQLPKETPRASLQYNTDSCITTWNFLDKNPNQLQVQALLK